MPYLRTRGNQLAIVHGEREPGNPNIRQRILFTIYSQAEAREILGRGGNRRTFHFEGLLEHQHPELKFNWKKIRSDIEKNLEVLPEQYEYGGLRDGEFREALCGFTRALLLTDPHELQPAAELIERHREELTYLTELIQRRLQARKPEPSEFNEDNAFGWRMALRGRDVPIEAEEEVEALYQRREYKKAAAVIHLLTDTFGEWVDGHLYLGLMALDEQRLEEALTHFGKLVEAGRRLFPPRIARKWYWRDHKTRPYMRGLMNLAITHNAMARYDEALKFCVRLEEECGDSFFANLYRAPVYLNTRRWSQAAVAARLSGGDADPSQGFIEAFARFELGQAEEALAAFLGAALRLPRAARMLMGLSKRGNPGSNDEISDHNAGVSLLRSTRAYLNAQPARTRRFFRTLVLDPRVARLLEETEEVVRRWSQERLSKPGDRSAFERMNQMRSPEFAAEQARLLQDLLPGAAASADVQ